MTEILYTYTLKHYNQKCMQVNESMFYYLLHDMKHHK